MVLFDGSIVNFSMPREGAKTETEKQFAHATFERGVK